jgi:hypothetical protein
MKARRVVHFFLRLFIAFVCVSAFFVVTQDFQVFPTLVSSTFGYRIESVPNGVRQSFVTTADGTFIDVWRVEADGDPHTVAVILHGNADTLPHVYTFQRFLAARGVTSYSFDYRGSGRSSGWPSERGIYLDGEAVLDFALKEQNITAEKLSILGTSIGSGPAAYLASRYSPASLVLVAPYYSFKELVSEMPLFGMLTPFLWYEFPTLDYLRQVRGTSITLIHGTSDRTIPIRHSERLVQVLSPAIKPTFVRMEGSTHNDVLGRAAEAVVAGLRRGK